MIPLILLNTGSASLPPPGTEVSLLPEAPSVDAEALRWHGGDHVRVVNLTPSGAAAQIVAAFSMTNQLRTGFGSGTTGMDFRTVFLCEPGTYNADGWPDTVPWTSFISATGTGEPDDVTFVSDAGSWGILGATGGLHLEGIRLNARFAMIDGVRRAPKYCIHDYGGGTNMAHCYLWAEDQESWGSGAVFGSDTNPGDHYQWFDVQLRSGVDELPPRAAWICNSHIDAGEVAPDPVRWRLKQVTAWSEGYVAWSSTVERREPVIMDSVWMEDCADFTFAGSTINRPTDPIVWDVL
jgi:hypothetical protein